MSKSKINIDKNILTSISESIEINDAQKINFLKYVGYLTISEQSELLEVI